MKVDRTIVIKRARDAGVKWRIIADVFQISITTTRQIYFNNTFLKSKDVDLQDIINSQ